MDIRYKLYPYPILSDAADDYRNSQLIFRVQQKLGIREVILKIYVELKNEGLLDLVRMDKAEFVVHIECPYTSYREALKFQDIEYVRKIPEKKLNGKVSVCAFLVAKVNIKNYINKPELFKRIELEKISLFLIFNPNYSRNSI